jgi:hypothetical protein
MFGSLYPTLGIRFDILKSYNPKTALAKPQLHSKDRTKLQISMSPAQERPITVSLVSSLACFKNGINCVPPVPRKASLFSLLRTFAVEATVRLDPRSLGLVTEVDLDGRII